MNRFLRIIIPIALVALISAYPLDRFISYLLKKSNEFPSEFEVMNDIYDGKAAADIAIYGSSRAWVHIDPQVIEDTMGMSSYNFGNDGHNFPMQYLRHKELLKHYPPPKLILLVIDFYSLYKEDSLYNNKQYLPYMLWHEDIEKYTSAYYGFDPLDFKVPLVRYFGREEVLWTCMKILLGKDGNKKLRRRGFYGHEATWSYHEEEVRKKAQERTWRAEPGVVALLDQFINECKSNHTKLVFIYAPEYIEAQQFIPNHQKMLDTLRAIADAHQLTFLDYSKSEISRHAEYFYNATHLNKTGAQIFSGQLAADIRKYWDAQAASSEE
ncbi:MAG: hypothetical protein KL787_09535 [Taibaiella sp.]|nr:hypothetical protein [Taibaiella sp.]